MWLNALRIVLIIYLSSLLMLRIMVKVFMIHSRKHLDNAEFFNYALEKVSDTDPNSEDSALIMAHRNKDGKLEKEENISEEEYKELLRELESANMEENVKHLSYRSKAAALSEVLYIFSGTLIDIR